jgi:hypothetical protein
VENSSETTLKMAWSKEVLMFAAQDKELHGGNEDDLGNWRALGCSAHRTNNI